MTYAITKGSLSDLAQASGAGLAEAFLSADTIILVDTSGSMNSYDGTRDTRYDRACAELARLQANLQGRIAVFAFSHTCEFCPGGVPTYFGQGTAMAQALETVHPADGLVDRFVLISDGYPDNGQDALTQARRFTTRIDCVFIGSEGDAGADFLRRLSDLSGGTSQAIGVGLLSERIERLMIGAPV